MRRFANLFAIFMLLLTAAPLLACMTDRAMSQQESACCVALHGKCTGMAKMACCQSEAKTDEHPQLAASTPTIEPLFAVVDWLEPLPSVAQHLATSMLEAPEEHSPPGLVTVRTTVLRI